MTQSDLFRSTSTFVFDGNPSGTAAIEAVIVASSNTIITTSDTAEPTNTMAAKAAALFRSRPNEWIDGREFANICGLYGWRTRISDLRRAPWFWTIDNRLRKDGRYTILEYRWNTEGRP